LLFSFKNKTKWGGGRYPDDVMKNLKGKIKKGKRVVSSLPNLNETVSIGALLLRRCPFPQGILCVSL